MVAGDAWCLWVMLRPCEAIIETLDDKLHPDVQRRALEFGVERAVEEYLNVLGFEE